MNMFEWNTEKVRVMKSMKIFERRIRKEAKLILFDFNKRVRKQKFKGTEYFVYDCRFIKLDGKNVEIGLHRIQMPSKTLWLQLGDLLERKEILYEKNISLTIIKKDNYHYTITLEPTITIEPLSHNHLANVTEKDSEYVKEYVNGNVLGNVMGNVKHDVLEEDYEQQEIVEEVIK